MEFHEILPYLNEISTALRGRDLRSGENIPYGQEIDSLIEAVGFDEFFKNANIYVKIEFLSNCSNKNFDRLIDSLRADDILGVIVYSKIDDLRGILQKLLTSDEEINYLFWTVISHDADYVDKIDDKKRFLLQGYLREFHRSQSTSAEANKSGAEEDVPFSEFKRLLSEYEHLRDSSGATIDELKSHIFDLEAKNKENIQNRIDKNLSTYVSNSVKELEKIEKKLKCAAARWSILSVFILFSGFAAGIGFALFGYMFGPELENLKWPELLIFSIKGIFIVSAFVAAAGYSFMKSNAFTHEAIIVSNRAHAIQFGKLYLEIYGNTVERSEMQKIFENWNISSDTAFLKAKNDKSDSVKFSEFLDYLKKIKEIVPIVNKD